MSNRIRFTVSGTFDGDEVTVAELNEVYGPGAEHGRGWYNRAAVGLVSGFVGDVEISFEQVEEELA